MAFLDKLKAGLSKTKNAIFGQINDVLKAFVKVDEDLLDELETEFGIGTYPMNWPISCGQTFKGVYDREKKCILTFETSHGGRERLRAIECDITDREKLDATIGTDLADTLCTVAYLVHVGTAGSVTVPIESKGLQQPVLGS